MIDDEEKDNVDGTEKEDDGDNEEKVDGDQDNGDANKVQEYENQQEEEEEIRTTIVYLWNVSGTI